MSLCEFQLSEIVGSQRRFLRGVANSEAALEGAGISQAGGAGMTEKTKSGRAVFLLLA